jgi:hypothetical protein
MKSMLRAVRSWLNEAPDADDLDHRQAFLADSDWITGRLTEANVRTPWGYFRDSLDGIYCQWNDCPVLGAVLEEVTAPVEQPPAPQIVRWHAWYKPSNYLSDRTKVKSATRPAETADYIYLDDAELAEYKALAEYEAAERSARPVQPSRRRRRSLTD